VTGHPHSVIDHGYDAASAGQNAEERLKDLQQQGFQSYTEKAQDLDVSPLPGSLHEYVTNRMMTPLKKLGFEKPIIQTLFGLASETWESLVTLPDNLVSLDSKMQHVLEEVRKGLLYQTDENSSSYSGSDFISPLETHSILQQTMDPANLHLALKEISTPWIILPRAYSSLKPQHASYLSAYLQIIEKETNEKALHIFTRIVIEFMANFAIRFADDKYPKNQVTVLVAAAYKALFWKNLHTPPQGFEDTRIFEHFLTWLKLSGSHPLRSNPELGNTIRTMEEEKSYIFPSKSESTDYHLALRDNSGFMVALRHGCLGIDCLVLYFCPGLPDTLLTYSVTAGGEAVLFSLKSLYDTIVTRYESESQRTRYYIREFIFQLKTRCENTSEYTVLDLQSRRNRQIVLAKTIEMTQQLQRTLSLRSF